MTLSAVPHITPGRDRVVQLLRDVADRVESLDDPDDAGAAGVIVLLVKRTEGGREFEWRRNDVGLNGMELYGVTAASLMD